MRSRFWITVCICLAFLGWSGCSLTGEDPSEKVFIKYFGGDGNQEGVDMLVDADGIFLLGTTSDPTLGDQFLLVKADFSGQVIFQKSFGGPLNDRAADIDVTADGRLIIVGSTLNGSGNRDVLFLITDKSGTELSRKQIDLGGNEIPTSVSALSDGGFIIAGLTDNVSIKASGAGGAADVSDAMQIRLDAALNLSPVWTRANGFAGAESAERIVEMVPPYASDGRDIYFLMFGNTNILRPGDVNSNQNFWIQPLGATGSAPGSRIQIGKQPPDVSNEFLTGVTPGNASASFGYLLTGISRNNSRQDELYITKVKSLMDFDNTRVTDGEHFQGEPYSAEINLGNLTNLRTRASVTSSGDFIVVSNIEIDGQESWLVTKVTSFGAKIWQTPIVFGGGGEDTIGAVQELSDGSIVVFGTFEIGSDRREKKMTLIKLTKDGKLQPE